MSFKIREVVYLTNMPAGQESMNGSEGKIVREKCAYNFMNPVTGQKGIKVGYGVSFEGSEYIRLIVEENLCRSGLERGDMDDKVSWESFTKATGISEDKVKGENRDY